MALYKRGKTWWTAIWRDGVRHIRSTGTGNRRLAEGFEQRFKDELHLREVQAPNLQPTMVFNDLSAKFLGTAEVKPHHIDRLKLLLPYFGEMEIGHISKADVRDYRRRRHASKKLTETTINRDLEVLRHILFFAVDEGYLMANPLGRLQMVRERRKRRFVLSVGEEIKLLPAAAPHLRSIIAVALGTGMRRGELLAQDWIDVDFERNLLFVTKSKTAAGEQREIPMTSEVAALLKAMPSKTGLLFTYRGEPIRRIKTAWKAALRRSGIRPLSFHRLRHTFNTRLLECGIVQEVRKALMGHSSGEDVNSIYTHVELPLKREAIRKLEAWLAAEYERAKQEQQTGGEDANQPGGPGGSPASGNCEGCDRGNSPEVP